MEVTSTPPPPAESPPPPEPATPAASAATAEEAPAAAKATTPEASPPPTATPAKTSSPTTAPATATTAPTTTTVAVAAPVGDVVKGVGGGEAAVDRNDPEFAIFLSFLRKYKLQDTEKILNEEFKEKRVAAPAAEVQSGTDNSAPAAAVAPATATVEATGGVPSSNAKPPPPPALTTSSSISVGDGSNVLSSYSSEGDPALYQEVYQDLLRFIESSLDLYRHELALILYPVFVHMYLELVYNCHEKDASAFIAKYGPMQESFFQNDIRKLSYITKKQHMIGSELMENFQTSQFTVRMSRDSYSQLRQLKKFMSEKYSVLWNIIQEHLYLDVYEGIARNKKQIDATSGGMIGESNRQANRSKVYFGLLKEVDIAGFLQAEEDNEPESQDKPKKKKLRKDHPSLKKQKNDPHAPPSTRMPFPELRDSDKAERAKAWKESQRRQHLGPQSLPSVCFYTVVNSGTSMSAVEFSDDSSLLAIGFSNAHIRVCSLVSSKLKGLKPASVLADIDNDVDDVTHRMIDDASADNSKSLLGHSGAVYGLSFSPDKQLLLSSSEDGTIRLWSLQTWTCLVVYKGHILPVWQVRFCPQGYYFASCSHDKTVRLWTTENSQCARLFVGHFSDVDCLTFHPNCNYVASGSSDRSVRLWDCVSGNCVRLMTGHKDVVSCLAFSSDGRFLASGGSDNRVLIWDIAHGHLLGDFSHHKGLISNLSFSRDSTVLASASNDFSVILWDFAKFTSELSLEEVNVTHNPNVNVNAAQYNIATFRTKDTPIFGIHFTRRNLLLSIGSYC